MVKRGDAALLGSDMLTNHTAGDTRAPALPADVAAYRHLVAITHPRDNDGGGYQTTSSYGPLYYYAVAPGYLVASGGSAFSQLEGVRLMSALIGALAAVFAFLTVRGSRPATRSLPSWPGWSSRLSRCTPSCPAR